MNLALEIHTPEAQKKIIEICNTVRLKHSMKELLKLITEMRELQIKYFKDRSATTLDAARQIEKSVDRKLQEIKNNQTAIF